MILGANGRGGGDVFHEFAGDIQGEMTFCLSMCVNKMSGRF